ncbi:Crp/Fnr family transcriptional regulator [Persephonella sp.]
MDLSTFFPSLSKEDLTKLKKISTLEKRKEGEILFREGDPPKKTYFLVEGIVKLYKTSYNHGNDITLNYILPPSFIGEFAILKGISYPLSAEMESDGKIITFKTDKFVNLINSNLNMAKEMLLYLANKVEKNYSYCEDLVEKNSKKKIAKFIKEHEDLFFKLKHNKIASILNITPETLSRTLRELRNHGLIEEKKIIKVNKEKLNEILNE